MQVAEGWLIKIEMMGNESEWDTVRVQQSIGWILQGYTLLM